MIVSDECSNPCNTSPEESTSLSLMDRLRHPVYLLIYGAILILGIIFIVLVFVGSTTTWYINLIEPNVNPWVVRGLWIAATIFSYLGYYLIIDTSPEPGRAPIDLIVSVYYLIGSFILLLWTVVFYYAENLALSLWLSIVVFVYRFWLFTYIWYIRPAAAIFLIPDLLIYAYLIYSVAHLAYLNNVPI